MLHQTIARRDRAPDRALPTGSVRTVTLAAGVHHLDLSQRRDTMVIMLSPARLAAPPLLAEVDVGPGWVVHFPAGACSFARLTGAADLLLIEVAPEVRLRLLLAANGDVDPAAARRVALVADDPQIASTVGLLAYLVRSDHAPAGLCLAALVRLLLLDIAAGGAAFACRGEAPRRGALDMARIEAIDRFIEAHLAGPTTLEQLSRLVGMSPHHFLRCFKKATGMSPLQYVIAKRVARARQMLREGRESIAEIAYATGFASQSHLNAMFKRHVGVTPGRFKRQFASSWRDGDSACPRPGISNTACR